MFLVNSSKLTCLPFVVLSMRTVESAGQVFSANVFFFVEKWHFILGRNCTVAAFKKRNPADSNVRKSHE